MLRMMRAIYESLEREGELQRQLRRTKETLVSVALRLQVAIKVSQEDEVTIASLVAIAEEAKAKEILATKRAEEAMEMINALTLEVNRLKRRVRAAESERQQHNPTGLLSVEQQQQMNEYADDEVEEMFEREVRTGVPRDISEKVLNAATPFDRWKMNQFLFAPDTPAASLTHDRDAVEMLVHASQEDLHYAPGHDPLTRPTKSAITKRRKAKETKSYIHNDILRAQTSTLGANDYEILNNNLQSLTSGLGGVDLNLSIVSPTRPGSVDKDDERFFLNSSAEQMWGTNSNGNTHGNGKFGAGPGGQMKKPGTAGVKLKSLRLDTGGNTPSQPLNSTSSKSNKPSGGILKDSSSSQKLQKLTI